MEFNDVEQEYNIYHNKRKEYLDLLGSETTKGTLLCKLKELKNERERYSSQKQEVDDEISLLVKNSDIDSDKFGMTSEEISIYNSLIYEKVYSNKNVVINYT